MNSRIKRTITSRGSAAWRPDATSSRPTNRHTPTLSSSNTCEILLATRAKSEHSSGIRRNNVQSLIRTGHCTTGFIGAQIARPFKFVELKTNARATGP
jgi:hypothetical protein